MSSDETDVARLGRRLSAVVYDQFFDASPPERRADQLRTEPKIGDCHIFDYQKFRNPRLGSEKDVERLYYDFHELNFNVHRDYKDLNKQQTLDALKLAAERSNKEHKYFVCCFLSHGKLGVLQLQNDDLEIKEILRCFSRSSCPNLKGIPKIFIFQACRGKCREDGISCFECKEACDTIDYDPVLDIPDFLDFLLIYSTYNVNNKLFETEDTKFFDNRRRESKLGSQSLKNPLADKQTYRIQESNKIKFLLLLNTKNNFESCLLQYVYILWTSIIKRNYGNETFSNWTEEELMDFLKEVAARDYSNTDCLICFVACLAKEDRLCDSKGNYFQMRKIIENFTGDVCSKLRGKPKIFIFLTSAPNDKSSVCAETTDCREDNLIPIHSDLLEVVITVQDSNQLKVVIEKLSQILGGEKSEDFFTQMTRMNNELVRNCGFHSLSTKKATFSINSTLTKILILNKPDSRS
ncbi:Caspase-3 like protein [Argiope bruennichi]|uniref:Caspase-3 like protein n=1 Tax=Argiope bruennichi TaxID=94029 RepID=A0A8T0FYU8_ARGBR|nr:Caspase-3 like protein [Argiope bruennichi]